MMNAYSNHPDLEFLDEEDTEPYVLLTAQRQLDRSESIASFVARAGQLGYGTEPPSDWSPEPESEIIPLEDHDILSILDEAIA